jgi:hypothetical protein
VESALGECLLERMEGVWLAWTTLCGRVRKRTGCGLSGQVPNSFTRIRDQRGDTALAEVVVNIDKKMKPFGNTSRARRAMSSVSEFE